jgi:two-component system cell cycle sensor histidine kinase/response regulator CckA
VNADLEKTAPVDSWRSADGAMRALFDEADDAKVVADDDGRVVAANASACALIGRPAEAIVGAGLASWIGPDADLPAAWRALLDAGAARGLLPIVLPGGARRTVEYRGVARIAEGRHLLVMRSLTEPSVAARTALASAEARFESMLHVTPTPTVITRLRDDRYVAVSDSFLDLLGYTREEALGRTAAELRLWPHAQDRARLTASFASGRPVRNLEVRVRTRAGVELTVLVSAERMEFYGEPCVLALANDITELRQTEQLGRTLVRSSPAAIIALDRDARVRLWNPAAERIFGWSAAEVEGRAPPFLTEETAEEFVESVRAGEVVEARDATYRRRDGVAVEVTLSRAPLRGPRGAVRGAVGILFDMTDRRMLEDQLRQARKMEVVGRFAGGIAHDFNNMLQVISGFASVARHSLPDEHPVHAELEQILRASSRAAQLTRQLLAFSRGQLTQSRVLDLNALVGDMSRMLQRLIGEHVRLEVRLDPCSRRVRGDVGQLEQVLLNLCVNARDAMPEGGVLTIAVGPARLDLDESRRHPEVAADGYVALRVTDTGTGMDAATAERAFDPFFSTKEPGQGTGLGLATVYGIVRQSGGQVWLSSEPGRGTTVTICLPGTDEAPQSIRPPPAQAKREGRGETVLVVEDEALVRRLAVQLLERHGYKVIEATDGNEGLRAYEAAAEEIRLVLTDVVMPGIDGVEMSRRIAQRHPEARTLYMTAWSGTALPVSMQRYAAVLDKPFTTEALLAAVRAALDRP